MGCCQGSQNTKRHVPESGMGEGGGMLNYFCFTQEKKMSFCVDKDQICPNQVQSLGHREIEEAGSRQSGGEFSRKNKGSTMHELEKQQC